MQPLLAQVTISSNLANNTGVVNPAGCNPGDGGGMCIIGLRGIFISSATITDNKAANLGGGMYIAQDSSITGNNQGQTTQTAGSSTSVSVGQVQLATTQLSRNSAEYAGGGIYFLWDEGLKLTGCNTGATRAAVSLYSTTASASALAPCSDWQDNRAPRGYGG
jgi:hypothetical protein